MAFPQVICNVRKCEVPTSNKGDISPWGVRVPAGSICPSRPLESRICLQVVLPFDLHPGSRETIETYIAHGFFHYEQPTGLGIVFAHYESFHSMNR